VIEGSGLQVYNPPEEIPKTQEERGGRNKRHLKKKKNCAKKDRHRGKPPKIAAALIKERQKGVAIWEERMGAPPLGRNKRGENRERKNVIRKKEGHKNFLPAKFYPTAIRREERERMSLKCGERIVVRVPKEKGGEEPN